MKYELSARDYVRFDIYRKIIDLCRDDYKQVKQINETLIEVTPCTTALYLRYLHHLGCLSRDVKQYGRFKNPMNVYKAIRQITNDELIKALTLKEFIADLSLKGSKRVSVNVEPMQEIKPGQPRTVRMEEREEKMREADRMRRRENQHRRVQVAIGTSMAMF